MKKRQKKKALAKKMTNTLNLNQIVISSLIEQQYSTKEDVEKLAKYVYKNMDRMIILHGNYTTNKVKISKLDKTVTEHKICIIALMIVNVMLLFHTLII